MQRFHALVLGALAMAAIEAQAQAPAPDLAAGKARAEQICAACHGANGVSVGPAIPNLAGQKAAYLAAQLRDFRSGARKNAIMNPIAAQIGPADAANIAAFYASLQGAARAADTSPMFPSLAMTKVKLPADYKRDFVHYTTVNYPERPQVRHLYANRTAVDAAKTTGMLPNGSVLIIEVYVPKLDANRKPVAGSDGNLVPDTLSFVTVMEKQPGWGADVPEILRNGDWLYGAYNPDRSMRAANQAECLACHKPLAADDYLFSLKPLREFAQKR